MLWDGKSKGTVNYVVDLSRDRKPVVVSVGPTTQFRTIKTLTICGTYSRKAIRTA